MAIAKGSKSGIVEFYMLEINLQIERLGLDEGFPNSYRRKSRAIPFMLSTYVTVLVSGCVFPQYNLLTHSSIRPERPGKGFQTKHLYAARNSICLYDVQVMGRAADAALWILSFILRVLEK